MLCSMTDDEPEGAPPGRRERKKRATYLALRVAALDLVAERGFAHVTVEDVAEAVDVSVRTFFNYFSSKEDAVVGDDPALRASMRAELLALPGEVAPLEALRHVLMGRLRAIREDLDLTGEGPQVWSRRFAGALAQPEVRAAYAKHMTVVEQFLTDALVERLGGDPALRGYAALVTASALAVMRTVGALWGGEEDMAVFLARAEAAFDLLAGGFPLESARQRLTQRLTQRVRAKAKAKEQA